MSNKPYDASLRDVMDAHPIDWALLLGAKRPRSVRVIAADVSTVTAAADKALLVDCGKGEYVLHPELQSTYHAELPKRIWWYSSVYHKPTDLPVWSVAVLLRPQADGSLMNGKYIVEVPDRPDLGHVFKYDVLRLWQLPVEKLLAGGIGILPLAPLVDEAAGQLPEVLHTIDKRLKAEADRDEADKLRAATSVLMGLRHSQDMISQLLKGMWPMWNDVLEDSSVIQYFQQKAQQRGEEEGRKIGEQVGRKIGEERGVKIGEERAAAKFRAALLRLGEKRFGPPDAQNRAAIETLTDFDRLAVLSERVLEVKNWNELLA